ncbi:hypothetical protein L596_009811 [Steinernema carpocapsae]|uniref:Uncharacterized protein n=1 Tax=Steinernema carpocapsae TaxID=34508 RepID=A0A4U5PGE8_STECR|nr:hypothetical protein L596_009811 [Steinernema carpocapsae]
MAFQPFVTKTEAFSKFQEVQSFVFATLSFQFETHYEFRLLRFRQLHCSLLHSESTGERCGFENVIWSDVGNIHKQTTIWLSLFIKKTFWLVS